MDFQIRIEKTGKIFEGQAPGILEQNLTAAMYEATLFLEGEVRKGTPQGVYGTQGGLISTIYSEVHGKGTPVVKGIVAEQSKYGEVIEKGRRPGQKMPPAGTLLRWIEVKMGVSAEQAARIEFLVRRKIGQKGFEGAHMFEKAITKGLPALQAIFEKFGFKIAQETNG